MHAATGVVICRSKMHAGLKCNFQVMPGAAWLELLCKHVPDRYEHLVRYVGWYSNRAASGQKVSPRAGAAGAGRGAGTRISGSRKSRLGATDPRIYGFHAVGIIP